MESQSKQSLGQYAKKTIVGIYNQLVACGKTVCFETISYGQSL